MGEATISASSSSAAAQHKLWTISLGQYFETILDWVDTNSLRINRDGVVELNLDASMKVAHTMNPGCDAWDDAMPPAHETRDWVGRREGNS